MYSNVCIIKTNRYEYPDTRFFRPDANYPEYLFENDLSKQNKVYEMVREGFHMMKFDIDNWNTSNWNPLGEIIKPGDKVVVKPNLVMDKNPSGEGTDCLYTNPSVVAAVVDYILIALKGEGKIIIGDAPMQECNFKSLIKNSGYERLVEFYKAKTTVEVSLLDFRDLTSVVKKGVHYSKQTVSPSGIVVRLDDESEFFGESDNFYENMRITNYDPQILKQHHSSEVQEYYINREVLDADVIINIPKPKTHRKAGVTIAMKNLVGINARKEYLPHHTNGSVEEGGDEYQRKSALKRLGNVLFDKRNYYSQTAQKYKKAMFLGVGTEVIDLVVKLFYKDKYKEGSWYGNDTISRTIVDLNKILFYADKKGKITDCRQRNYLIVADMILSGEKEGPVCPSKKEVGIIAMGCNPVCFDEAIAKLMGAKAEYIKTLQHARKIKGKCQLVGRDEYPYLISNDSRWMNKKLDDIGDDDILYFEPTTGWKEAFISKG